MWQKPPGDDLLPVWMQETMGFFKASAVYFGSPLIMAFLLLRLQSWPLGFLFHSYRLCLETIFTQLRGLYLIHLFPALFLRFFCVRRRWSFRAAFFAAVVIDFLAILIVYPVRPLLDPETLRNIYFYIAPIPLLMTFLTLRIHHLRFFGALVIALFLGMLSYGCWQI